MYKNEIKTFSNTIHKNKLKMDQKPTCKSRLYRTPRGKQRQNTLNINHSNIFFDPPPAVMKIKTNET